MTQNKGKGLVSKLLIGAMLIGPLGQGAANAESLRLLYNPNRKAVEYHHNGEYAFDMAKNMQADEKYDFHFNYGKDGVSNISSPVKTTCPPNSTNSYEKQMWCNLANKALEQFETNRALKAMEELKSNIEEHDIENLGKTIYGSRYNNEKRVNDADMNW